MAFWLGPDNSAILGQGIFSYWIHAHHARKTLRYIGFGGHGHQVRACLHPRDLAALLLKQIAAGLEPERERICNVSGGLASSRSLAELTRWCDHRFGLHAIERDVEPRPFDLPWVVLDSSLAAKNWAWAPQISAEAILEEIAEHAVHHPEWLEISRSD